MEHTFAENQRNIRIVFAALTTRWQQKNMDVYLSTNWITEKVSAERLPFIYTSLKQRTKPIGKGPTQETVVEVEEVAPQPFVLSSSTLAKSHLLFLFAIPPTFYYCVKRELWWISNNGNFRTNNGFHIFHHSRFICERISLLISWRFPPNVSCSITSFLIQFHPSRRSPGAREIRTDILTPLAWGAGKLLEHKACIMCTREQ